MPRNCRPPRVARLRLAVLVLALAVPPLGSLAATSLLVRAEASAMGLRNDPAQTRLDAADNAPLSASANNLASIGSNLGMGMAYGDISRGLGLAVGESRARASGAADFSGNGSGSALTNLQWSDRLTVTGPGLSGPGTLNASVLIVSMGPYTVQAAPTALAEATASGSVGLVQLRTPMQPEQLFLAGTEARAGLVPWFNNTINGQVVGSILGEWQVQIPFEFGRPFELRGTVGSFVTTRASFGEVATAHIGLMMQWGGIPSATLPVPASSIAAASGITITEFAVIGSAGDDWRLPVSAPVPEPAGAALWAAGLGMLVAWSRRRLRTAPAPAALG